MPKSYEERMAERAARAAQNERDPEKLKKWYELAAEGAPDLEIKAEDPAAQIAESSRIIESQKKPKKPKPSGSYVIPLDQIGIFRDPIGKETDRHLRPKLPLGKAAHRQIYAVAESHHQAKLNGRDTVTPEEIESYGKEWDSLEPAQQHFWQQSPHGKKATEEAIAARTIQSTPEQISAVSRQRNRAKVAEVALGSQEAVDRFKSTGELLDENGEQERDWRKPFALSSLTSQSALTRTRTGFQKEGMALHSDPQHHQALSDHIDELMRRPSATAPSNLQGGQFNVKEGLANAAKESLARSAMAHSLGMKDLAIQHFGQAVKHAGDLAEAIHDRNSQPIADWDKQDGIQSKYIKSVNGGR